MGVDLGAVLAEERSQVGFVEGPGNANPWGTEQGISNAAYCDSFASMCPYHHGYRWWPESQFGEKGCAYCPSHVAVGQAHGEVRFDHASRGDPADILAGDLLFYDWNNNGVADHVETAAEDVGTAPNTHNYGANTGSPEGVHETWRNRSYLLCRLRPTKYRDGSVPSPVPAPPPPPPITPAPPKPPPPSPGGLPAPRWPGVVFKTPPDTRGSGVATWQQRMHDRGWNMGSGGPAHNGVDDDYGPTSKGICIAFQREKGLTVDGEVGPNTWAAAWTAPVT
jgi:hypothetical protein